MLKFRILPMALVSFGLPLMAAADGQTELEQQLSYMKGEFTPIPQVKARAKLFGRQATLLTTSLSGTLIVGKAITYDSANHTPYNEEPRDSTTFNMVVAGYMPSPAIGSVSLSGVSTLAFARVVKLFNTPPVPEADLICNLFMTSSEDVQGVNIAGTYLPLTKVGSSVKNGTTHYNYQAVALDTVTPNYPQYFRDEHAFCTTFESFNNTYPNGANVPVTLTP
ncbi:hypothetical protein TUM18999_51990 [Pseudomonas tohonis]|uniref:Uncharacterized protein n=2 Tax=Pseudomonas tohonis TaxID=2725477 RepID=A0A6J4EC46_9PSED|nr:hypothetical protein [Pseudomonas tohonis]BCG27008.1 hypothetical protein TUM18999_51990 [Pseudomonas tohonis]GJN50256.1 hypothetical protein TUM20286_00080 [Pseudomonas tohonis]